VLFPNLTGIIGLEVVASFLSYKNTQINLTMAILAETILTLNHCKRIGKGSMRCYKWMLYVWLISHIETKNTIFKNF
jgi:hypothetical protein